MNADLVLLVTSIFLGSLFTAISIPLVQKRIPPNRLYGLRIPATFADETVWYEANARAGKDILMLGLLMIVIGVALYFTKVTLWLKLAVWVFVIESGLMGMLIRSWRFANRLLRVRQEEDA